MRDVTEDKSKGRTLSGDLDNVGQRKRKREFHKTKGTVADLAKEPRRFFFMKIEGGSKEIQIFQNVPCLVEVKRTYQQINNTTKKIEENQREEERKEGGIRHIKFKKTKQTK